MVVNVLLYDSFETMDAFVPVSILGKLPEHFYMNYLSASGGIINSSQDVKVWTEPLGKMQGRYSADSGRKGCKAPDPAGTGHAETH